MLIKGRQSNAPTQASYITFKCTKVRFSKHYFAFTLLFSGFCQFLNGQKYTVTFAFLTPLLLSRVELC